MGRKSLGAAVASFSKRNRLSPIAPRSSDPQSRGAAGGPATWGAGVSPRHTPRAIPWSLWARDDDARRSTGISGIPCAAGMSDIDMSETGCHAILRFRRAYGIWASVYIATHHGRLRHGRQSDG